METNTFVPECRIYSCPVTPYTLLVDFPHIPNIPKQQTLGNLIKFQNMSRKNNGCGRSGVSCCFPTTVSLQINLCIYGAQQLKQTVIDNTNTPGELLI